MAKIIPITELAEDPLRVSDLCRSADDPVFLTRNGYGDMVVMSTDYFEKLFAKAQAYDSYVKMGFAKNIKTEAADSQPEESKDKTEAESAEPQPPTKGMLEKLPLEDVVDILRGELDRSQFKKTKPKKQY